MDKITPQENKSQEELDGLRPQGAAILVLKEGKRYVGETGRITHPLKYQGLKGYFVSKVPNADPERDSGDPLFGCWAADGSPFWTDGDSLTRENFGALVSEVAA